MNSAERNTPTSVQHLPSSDAVARSPFIDASANCGIEGHEGKCRYICYIVQTFAPLRGPYSTYRRGRSLPRLIDAFEVCIIIMLA